MTCKRKQLLEIPEGVRVLSISKQIYRRAHDVSQWPEESMKRLQHISEMDKMFQTVLIDIKQVLPTHLDYITVITGLDFTCCRKRHGRFLKSGTDDAA